MAEHDGTWSSPQALNTSKISNTPRDSRSIPVLKPSNGKSSKEAIRSIAAKISGRPFHHPDPDVWGVLTAISEKARKRPQGKHLLLSSNVHKIGRVVEDYQFRFNSPTISALHCKIFRKRVPTKDTQHGSDVFLKDYSTNGTFLNWECLNKNKAKLCHGDIISFALGPKHGFVFVFQEVQKSSLVANGGSLKRKSEKYGAENKRLKGIGIGAFDGPISLDDFRSLQRSNTEYNLLEPELRESNEKLAKSYQDQLSQLNLSLEAKEKELEELTKISADLKCGMEDLTERLSTSTQSCLEANEIINRQKASISELKSVLDEERDQRQGERDEALLDRMALQSMRKELECEKAAREEACAKVSALELEISAAVRDLDIERRSLEGARERILLSETQLHAFYSTTEEISTLLAKQQEQLKSMQRTLEDEKNHEAASIDINLNRDENRSTMDRDNNNKEMANESNNDEVIVTKKNESQNNAKGAFGSDVDGIVEISRVEDVETEHIPKTDGISVPLAFEGIENATEIESQIAKILTELNLPVVAQDPMEDTGVKRMDILALEVMPLVCDSSSLVAKVNSYSQPRREGLRPRKVR